VHRSRHRSLSSQERLSLLVPLRSLCPTLRHRRLTRTRRDRSRYPGQISRLMLSTIRRPAPMRVIDGTAHQRVNSADFVRQCRRHGAARRASPPATSPASASSQRRRERQKSRASGSSPAGRRGRVPCSRRRAGAAELVNERTPPTGCCRF